jgi:hypothetical protein
MGRRHTHYVFPPDIGGELGTAKEGYRKDAEKGKRGGRLKKQGAHLRLVSGISTYFTVPSF